MTQRFEVAEKWSDIFGYQFTPVSTERADEIIASAAQYCNTTTDEIRNRLNAGLSVPFGKTPNYYYTHAKQLIRVVRPVVKPVLVKCSCGHSIPKSLVMSASLGTSCPDCYDRLS